MYQYFSLFLSALLAATVLPFSSEVLLVTLMHTESMNHTFLLIAVSTGNILGAVINWYLGKRLLDFQYKSWFPIKEKERDKATSLFNRYGRLTLLFAWLPIIGDPLTLIAGFLKVNFFLFLLLVSIGKIGRYIAIMFLFN